MEGMRDSGGSKRRKRNARAMMAGTAYHTRTHVGIHRSHLVGPEEADVAGLDAHDAAHLLLDGGRGAGGLGGKGDEEGLVLALDADVAATGAAVCLVGGEGSVLCVGGEQDVCVCVCVRRASHATWTCRKHHACPYTDARHDLPRRHGCRGLLRRRLETPVLLGRTARLLLTSEEERDSQEGPADGNEAAAACRTPCLGSLLVYCIWMGSVVVRPCTTKLLAAHANQRVASPTC